MGDVHGRLDDAQRTATEAGRILSELLARLSGWSGTGDKLARASLPPAAIVELIEGEFDELRTKRRQIEAVLQREAERLRRADASIAALQTGGEVPSPAALQAARERRERSWHVIRRLYVDALQVKKCNVQNDPGDEKIANDYEGEVRRADALADRRSWKQKKFADLEFLTRDRADALAAREEASNQIAQFEVDQSDLSRRWHALWVGSGVTFDSPTGVDFGWLRRMMYFAISLYSANLKLRRTALVRTNAAG